MPRLIKIMDLLVSNLDAAFMRQVAWKDQNQFLNSQNLSKHLSWSADQSGTEIRAIGV